MKICIGEKDYSYHVEGENFIDSNYRLIDRDDDLSKYTPWHRKGYIIADLSDFDIGSDFYHHLGATLNKTIKSGGIELNDLPPDQYHSCVKTYDQHLKVIDKTKLVDASLLEPHFTKLENIVSELCGIPVQSIKPMNNERVFHFRIVRPNQTDFNPLHKDGWMDELRDCINLYIPICGSNESSSLILAEGSHLLTEDTFVRTKHGALMNGVRYNVPGLISSSEPLYFVRPNPKPNQMLLFSPYLIHGGAINLNLNQTRISLEMRFWRKD